MTDPLKDHRLEEIFAYHDGLLSDEQRRELEAHIATCPACQKTNARAATFLTEVRQAMTQPEISSEELLARAKAELSRRQSAAPVPFRGRKWMRPALFTLAAAAAVAALLLVIPHRGPPSHVMASPHRPAVDAGPDGGVGVDGGGVLP